MFVRSPSPAGAASGASSLRTGSLSPVRAASATVSDAASSRRASAATASPSPSTSTSPGTTSCAGIRTSSPSRTTVAVGAAMRWRAATASSARRSWRKPSTPLATTITAVTMASKGTPSALSATHATTDTTVAATRRYTSGSGTNPFALSIRMAPQEADGASGSGCANLGRRDRRHDLLNRTACGGLPRPRHSLGA